MFKDPASKIEKKNFCRSIEPSSILCHVFTVTSVADPDVIGPPGSGSFSTRCGCGTYQAKIVRNTLIPIPTVFPLFILENDVKNVAPKKI
jgi:hypothetical protein